MVVAIGQIGGPMIAAILADMTGDYRTGSRRSPFLRGWGRFSFIIGKTASAADACGSVAAIWSRGVVCGVGQTTV